MEVASVGGLAVASAAGVRASGQTDATAESSFLPAAKPLGLAGNYWGLALCRPSFIL